MKKNKDSNTNQDTQHYGDFINQPLGQTKKVDEVIIFALIKWSALSSETYSSEQERKYKYLAMRDLISTSLDPFIVPKVSDPAWAQKYFEVTKKLESKEVEFDLEYFWKTLKKAMQLFALILYSNGYYYIESITDKQYKEWMSRGAVVGKL